ncbi:16S rRNA processing protein RimM [Ilyomonas limi]|uniref:Ribosome maturation factor RimM n=1 Tax=Ilyomonas limi TaxID=2575867 RepID=A0A4V5UTF4_9BACT|nr:ribosome maturation factor RimM [Ilyomonas limi]TKK64773.1 16S rRNA processing protein RimM [Ilyomonas limi]
MDYIHIGKIAATFGVKGEVVLVHGLEKKSNFKEIEVLFVEEVKNSFLPYFIQAAKAKDAVETYIKLEGVETREAAHRFVQKQVWLQQEDFEKVAGKRSKIGLLGFAIVDGNNSIGNVEEVIEQPHQVLLRTTYNKKEAYIPLHEETLIKIDRKKKEILVSLPDGLLDVYS